MTEGFVVLMPSGLGPLRKVTDTVQTRVSTPVRLEAAEKGREQGREGHG